MEKDKMTPEELLNKWCDNHCEWGCGNPCAHRSDCEVYLLYLKAKKNKKSNQSD